jgi:L-ascorbate metabolism protein UlaG (beta-lactamase superfamily)
LAHLNYIGHGTVLIDIGRIRVLTDPILRDRVLLLQRHGPNPAPELLAGRDPDIVLISHLHYDHADLPSLRRLPATTTVIAPRGSGRFLERWAGVEVHEVVEGEKVQVADVEISALPAEHSASPSLPRPVTACLGYLLRNHQSVYFAGDTDLAPGMGALGQAHDLDVALLPVSGYGPHLGPGHLNPWRAAQALTLLRPRIAVPIHWGALRYPGPHSLWKRARYLTTPPRAFAEHASHLAPKTEVRVLEPGEWTAL